MSHATRIITVMGVLCGIICVAVLHIVRTDLSPLSDRLSEYANGSYGWLMATAFTALASGIAALGIGLWTWRGRDPRAWVILSTALLASVGTMLSGEFRTGDSDISETIHSRASAVAVVAVVALALTHSAPFARDKSGVSPGSNWSSHRHAGCGSRCDQSGVAPHALDVIQPAVVMDHDIHLAASDGVARSSPS